MKYLLFLLAGIGIGIIGWDVYERHSEPEAVLEVRHTANDSTIQKSQYYLPVDTTLVKHGNLLSECHRPKGALVVFKVKTENQLMSGAYVKYTLIDDQGCVFHHTELLRDTKEFKPRLSVGDTINKGKY